MNLEQIRARMAQSEAENQVEKPKPIPYDHYLTWHTLKNPKTAEVTLPIVHASTTKVEDTLECPKCENDYMHHLGVEMFNCQEDQPGEHISMYVKESHGWDFMNVQCPDHTVDDDIRNNPSSRRTGISILFTCEHCQDIMKLNIAQHKGQTKVYWSFRHDWS